MAPKMSINTSYTVIRLDESIAQEVYALFRLGATSRGTKRIVIALFFLLAAPLWATTRTAASCSASDVQTAINASVDGDTVLIPNADCPSGSPANWTAAVTVTTGIFLNAQGSYIAFGSGGSLTVTGDTVHGALVENFNFSSTGGGWINWNLTQSDKPGRFTGNTIADTGASTLIAISGLGTLLIDHNTLTNGGGAAEVIHILGLGAGNDNWTDDLTPGEATMVYIEDNTFNCNPGTGVTGCLAEEAFYGSEFAFRHNTLNYEDNDVHDGDGGRWYEIYDNTYTFATTGGQGCFPAGTQLRGGSGLFYGNVVSGSRGCSDPNPTTNVGPDCPSSDTCTGTWPVNKQVGRGINETTYSPLYLWGNDASVITQTGQSLVVVGTAVTDPTNCSSHPGNVCDAVSTATKPSLERCQNAADISAGCPVTYTYTAWTYPYPLTGDGLPNPGGGSSYTITVSSITGSGTVTSSDSVINCTTGTTGTCADSSATGTVTLTFTPVTGYSLETVAGCTVSGSTCSVTATATITATFTIAGSKTVASSIGMSGITVQ